MPKPKFADIMHSCHLLVEQKNWKQLVPIFEMVWSTFGPDEWLVTLNLLELISETEKLKSLDLALMYAKALNKNSKFIRLLEFTETVSEEFDKQWIAPILVEHATALYTSSRFTEALKTLNLAMPHLTGKNLGLAWSVLGLVRFQLGDTWVPAFQHARVLLQGVELGKMLLNQGYCLSQSHLSEEACAVWMEALVCFKGIPRLLAWTRYNLGITTLRNFEVEAERHFIEAERYTKNPKAVSMRASVLSGLGAVRRSLGEWSRAEFVYLEALKFSQDSHDSKEAHFGLIRTLRLSNRAAEALETLEFALQDQTLNHDQIQISRAMTFLALNQNTAARDALSKVGTLVSLSDRWLFKIAQAEILRRDGNLENAVELLEGLPVHTLHAREEARCFPELMQLLYAANKPFPKPLEYVQGITVRVVAQGLLSVRVNDRPINLSPTSRAGELLVYLLEHGGSASIDMIVDAMFTHLGIDERKKARGAIWNLVKTLRQALGWQNSVAALRGAYQLDPNVTWQYDMREARAKRHFQGEFLKGVYSDWALEVGRELAGMRGERRKNLELN